jgi:hypothetical protein
VLKLSRAVEIRSVGYNVRYIRSSMLSKRQNKIVQSHTSLPALNKFEIGSLVLLSISSRRSLKFVVGRGHPLLSCEEPEQGTSLDGILLDLMLLDFDLEQFHWNYHSNTSRS